METTILENERGLQNFVFGAIEDVYHRQPELWRGNLSERARVAEIFHALRVSPLIHGCNWNVDLEWNKEGENGTSKRLQAGGGRYGTPDLVIHRRGQYGFGGNLLVAEFKNSYRSSSVRSDAMKVKEWMDRFGYQYGLVLAFGPNGMTYRPQGLWIRRTDVGNLSEEIVTL